MPRGISLHIGINNLDSNHYTSEFGKLFGCHKDARQLANIAKQHHFEVSENHILLDNDAVIGKITNGVSDSTTKFSQIIEKAINELVEGDIFLFTFSGHGSEIIDPTGKEPTGKNQTLCFFDRQMIDNELAQYWIRFKPGVRIIFISDSCHSGTLAESLLERSIKDVKLGRKIRLRSLPSTLSNEIVEAHQEVYQPIFDTFENSKTKNQQKVQAYLISMTACQDDQKARDSSENGLFTGVLKTMVNSGEKQLNYEDFFETVKQKTIQRVALLDPINGKQEPNLLFLGPEEEGFKKFQQQKPFEIVSVF
jgi:hypothetical protein